MTVNKKNQKHPKERFWFKHLIIIQNNYTCSISLKLLLDNPISLDIIAYSQSQKV